MKFLSISNLLCENSFDINKSPSLKTNVPQFSFHELFHIHYHSINDDIASTLTASLNTRNKLKKKSHVWHHCTLYVCLLPLSFCTSFQASVHVMLHFSILLHCIHLT
jgi:hypothetical protein